MAEGSTSTGVHGSRQLSITHSHSLKGRLQCSCPEPVLRRALLYPDSARALQQRYPCTTHAHHLHITTS